MRQQWLWSIVLTIVLSLSVHHVYFNGYPHEIYKRNKTNNQLRVDLINYGYQDSDIEILEATNLLSNSKPAWFKHYKGIGTVLHLSVAEKSDNYTIKLKTNKAGLLHVFLRAPEERINNKSIPILIEYNILSINGKMYFYESKQLWHDVPYTARLKVSKDEVITIRFVAQKAKVGFDTLQQYFSFDWMIFIIISALSFLLLFKLVTYLIRFKTEKNHSYIDIVFLAFFFALLFTPMLHISKAQKSEQENRVLSEKPQLNSVIKKGGNYGANFEKWFNDRFFGRTEFIALHDKIKYNFNSIIKNEKAFYDKKSNWMFNFPLVLDTLNENNKKNIAQNIVKLNEWCAKRGIKFYVLVIPKKESIYQDILKQSIGFKDEEDKIFEKYMSDIQKDTVGVNIIYPYDELKKASQKDFVFFKNSHHWTDWGAYIGYEELMEKIKKDFPDINVVSLDDYKRTTSNLIRDDWLRDFNYGHTTNLLNIDGKKAKEDIFKTEYNYYDNKDANNMKIRVGKYIKEFEYKKGKYKILVIGNSQNEDLMQYLPYSANKLRYIRVNKGQAKDGKDYKLIKYYKNEIFNFNPNIMILTIGSQQIHNCSDIFKD